MNSLMSMSSNFKSVKDVQNNNNLLESFLSQINGGRTLLNDKEKDEVKNDIKSEEPIKKEILSNSNNKSMKMNLI